MANNPYVNKVQKADGSTLIDLTSDTATESDVLSGKYFHKASGERVQGTLVIPNFDSSVNLDDCSTLADVFTALLDTDNGIGVCGIGNNENTNIRTLLGNPGQGAYVECLIRIIAKNSTFCIAICVSGNVITDGGIKFKYIKKAGNYYGQTEWT